MKLWKGRRKPPSTAKKGFLFDVEALNQYVDGGDFAANAVALVPGWNHRVPVEGRVLGGARVSHEDPRIRWAMDRAGGVAGRRVLEIGPLEAAHTAMLARAGAVVSAVEANKLAFLKCLVVKELCDLPARFFLAEANEWLDATPERFDLVVACGVLYHMREPAAFLRRIGRKTDSLYLWTHFVDEAVLAEVNARAPGRAGPTEIPCSYDRAAEDPAFCGGVLNWPRWMTLDAILATLGEEGFDEIETADQATGPGASISIFARRSGGVTAG